jgi:hypothetical protein
MDVPCLVNESVVLVDCELVNDVCYAAIFQCPAHKVLDLRGTEQTVMEPKKPDGLKLTITIPTDITELYYDAQFTYRPLATA